MSPEAPRGEAALQDLLARMLDAQLDAFAEQATGLGLDAGAHADRRGRLDIASSSALQAYHRQLQGFAVALRGFQGDGERDGNGDGGGDGLSPMARIDRDAVLFHTEATLESARLLPADAASGFMPYAVTQLSGAYCAVPDLLCTRQPLDDADDAEAFLARLAAFGPVLRDESARLAAASDAGVRPPAFVIDTTLRQLRRLLDGAAADSPIVRALADRTAARGIAGDWAARATDAIEHGLRPAVQAQIEQLAGLRARADDRAGVWALPGGSDWYANAIVGHTTTHLTAGEIHRIGLAQVDELTARIEAELRRQGLASDGTVAERLAALARDERHVYPNDAQGRAQLLAELRALVADMSERLPAMFDPLPRAGLEVRGVPPEIEAGAPRGYYVAGPADGSRPGAFYANLRDTRDWKRWYAPSFAYHEGVPGHHLQIALALQTEGISMMRRSLWFAAYGEGWALYAEQLADEMGVYEHNPIGRIGYLQSMLFRAARLVVDTGLHDQRWTRQQAVAYLVGAVGETESRASAEVDRYCVMPAQALSYKIGHLRWQSLREAARRREGAAFDLRRFHGRMLRWGAMPLSMLEALTGD